jgi:pyrroline-5-carboxylate reductase
MIKGILKSGLVEADDIYASDSDEYNQRAVDFANYIFLTIKPQMYEHVISKLTNIEDKVFITVAPGIKTTFIPGAKVIRTMPNTPALVGAGVTAVCRGKNVTDTEFEFVRTLLSSFSSVYEFEEDEMNYTVAISGSGPVYGYMLIEAMADYAEKHGLDYDASLRMVAQTLLGAAQMVLKSGEMPSVLRENVCSEGGATIEAVGILQENKFHEIIEDAMRACTHRAKELEEQE